MPTPPVDPKELARRKGVIEDCLREGFAPINRSGVGRGSAVMEAARRLGASPGAITYAVRSGDIKPDWSLFKAPASTVDPHYLSALPPDERREVIQLRDRVRFLENQIKEIERESISAELVREKILGLSKHVPAPPKWLTPAHAPTAHGPGVPSVIWSDWHIGERVSLAETNGVNEFSLEIAERRIRTLVERVIDLCFNHMVAPKYPGIVVNLLGDIISGGIHPDLSENDEDETFPLILWVVDRLIWALTSMADRFGKVFVPCAPGNHGRVFDKKPRAKRYAERNADWLIYSLLERHFSAAKDNRVQFLNSVSGEALYSIYGHRYMAVHGDDLGVRGGDGIIGALGPIARGEIKVRHSSAQIDRDYDTLLMGHWHQQLWLPRAIVNNCLKGYDEYARRFLRAISSTPSQALWFTHPRHGITCRWEVLLEGGEIAHKGDWVSWKETKRAA